MDKHVFYFQDENLTAEKAGAGALHIIVGSDGLSLLALDGAEKVMALEAVQFSEKRADNQLLETELPQIISSEKVLGYAFGKSICAFSTPMVTLVPKRLFSPDGLSRYFHLLQPPPPQTTYAFEEIKDFECYLVWGIDPVFQRLFGHFPSTHLGTSLIRVGTELSSPQGFTILLNIRNNEAQILVYEERNLLYYNHFEFIKPADLLYFVLLVYDQFKQDPAQLPLMVTGGLLESSDCFKMLYRYVNKIEFIKPFGAPEIPKSSDELPLHFWFDLLNLRTLA